MLRPWIRRCFAGAIAFAFLAPQSAPAGLLQAKSTLSLAHQTPPRAALTPPKPIAVSEPARKKPSHPRPSAIKPALAKFVRAPAGIRVAGPPMAQPSKIAEAIVAAHKLAVRAMQRVPTSVGTGQLTRAPSRGRTVHSINGQAGPGTGAVPWWKYAAESVPGATSAAVNVGTGNLILQYTDMSVPHKGVPMKFMRTYNSQTPATVIGSTSTWQSLYGNGWTNTFDAHLVATGSTWVSVYDVDGARYDYFQDTPPNGPWLSSSPGAPGTLAYDGGCGMVWTKTDGTAYDFFNVVAGSPCWSQASYAAYGGLAGRLHQIIGRNMNTTLTFAYAWDGGIASPTGKVNQITVTAESGMATNLYFGDVSGRRLLQQLKFPDGTTNVTYGYDSQGNLTSVTRPSNNYNGTTPQIWYGYNTVGSDQVMEWATSPRWAVQCNQDNCGGDGAYIGFAYSGTSGPTSTVSSVQSFAAVNPAISDGYASYGALQSGFPTYAYSFRTEYYTTGVSTPTLRDTDGHYMNWVTDGSNRVTQTQVCTVTPASGSSCPTANLLVTNESWDGANNRTQIVDPRGGVTDMAYAGNMLVAIAQPPQYQGFARPTTLIDYGPYGNVTAVCDPALVHSGLKDWNGQYTPVTSTTYCSSQFSSGHAAAAYTYPSYEPYGELSSMTSAGGYTTQISYDLAPQGGTDYGLPTKALGASSISQFDGTSRTPEASLTYDANGNVVCTQTDAGTATSPASAVAVNTYDALGRLTAAADPDDASLAGACTGKTAGIASSSIVTRSAYYADGSLQTTQSPSQAAASAGTVFAYDLDGNPTSEAPYTGSPSSPQTATMRRWFDGLDRLVETQEPPDPNTTGDLPISLRYVYDLSQNGTAGSATTLNGTSVSAFGNMFDTEKNTPTGWTDFTFSAFDSADRLTTKYAFAPCPAQTGVVGPIYCSQPAYATRYYWDSSSANPSFTGNGLLVATTDGVGVTRRYGYDALNGMDTVQYVGDVGSTPQVSYAHDYDERLSDMWNSFTAASAPSENHVSFTYTADGALYQKNNTTLNTAVGYAYYSDATLAGVSTTAQSGSSYVVNQPNLYQYAYRSDGKLSKEAFSTPSQAVSWSYTVGGRTTAQSDFSGTTQSAQYDGYGRPSSLTSPNGSYNSFSYDAFGRMKSYRDPYYAVDGETVTSTYNIRGDFIARSFSGGAASSKPGFQYENIQGVLVQNPTYDQWDGRTGAPLVNYSGQFTYDAVGRLKFGYNGGDGVSSLTYDGENRLVAGDTFGASSAEDFDCHSGGAVASWAPPGMEQSYVYDGLGQMFQDRQPNTTFNNRVVTHIRQWMWNGSGALFTLSAPATWNGAIGGPMSYSADGLGSMAVANMALTLSDRDVDGAVAQYHNNTGHSSWNATNSYNQFCISANPLPASPAYSGPDNAVVPDDGSSDQSLVVSSYGRAFLSRSMGYTTPDYGSATPYSGHSRGLLGRYDENDGCPIGYGLVYGGACLPFINDPPTHSRPSPFDCLASSPQCGFLPTPDDPFGFSDRYYFRAGAPLFRPPQTTKSCNGSPRGFALPPNAPGIPLAFDAGRVHGGGIAAVRANVGSGGMFDYQRYGLTGPNSGYNAAWIPASNFVVGVYSNGARISVPAMDSQGSIYSQVKKEPTPLGALIVDVPLWNAGWGWAAANCR